jgi:threonine/homoserine/homoserine lactone efflux protein
MMAGLATNLLNPKVSIFFLALFTQIIDPATPEPVKILYGATMVAVELLWFGSVACFIGSPGIRRRLLRVGPWIDRLTGGALMALGLRLAIIRGI